MSEWKEVDQTAKETAADYRKKADWHRRRFGDSRTPNASLTKMGEHYYNAELMERGVKDASGAYTPLRSKYAFK